VPEKCPRFGVHHQTPQVPDTCAGPGAGQHGQEGTGRGQATLKTFFDEIGGEPAWSIEAIAIDMLDPSIANIEACAPLARIAFDKFHVIRKYSWVIDRLQLEELRRAEGEDKPVLRGTK